MTENKIFKVTVLKTLVYVVIASTPVEAENHGRNAADGKEALGTQFLSQGSEIVTIDELYSAEEYKEKNREA